MLTKISNRCYELNHTPFRLRLRRSGGLSIELDHHGPGGLKTADVPFRALREYCEARRLYSGPELLELFDGMGVQP